MPILKLGTGTLLYTPPYFSNSLSLSNYCFLRKMWHHSRTTLAPSHQCYSAITTTTICECAASLCTKNATQKLFSSKSIFFSSSFLLIFFFFLQKWGKQHFSSIWKEGFLEPRNACQCRTTFEYTKYLQFSYIDFVALVNIHRNSR